MSDRELREYYRNKSAKPTYFTVRNDSVKLFCATAGNDTLPPLLLVHGAPGAWYGSRNVLDDTLLQQHYHIIAVDRLGYNMSRFKGKRRAVTSITTQAVAIHEALRLNKSRKKGIVMGSSFGGPIAAKLAIMYPEDFYHVVMLAAAIDPKKEKFWWFHRYIVQAPLKWCLPRFINNATDEKMSHVKELEKLQLEWSNLNIPATVVQGGADDIVDPANLDFAREQLKGKKADFIFLPTVKHMIRWERADLVKEILLTHVMNSPMADGTK
ncbi:MAG: alpha/beta hydrolase [Gemmatimonadaceae bacterium]|nr:alpha/beta hydrolase [Chitinophagaceae bacterium]